MAYQGSECTVPPQWHSETWANPQRWCFTPVQTGVWPGKCKRAAAARWEPSVALKAGSPLHCCFNSDLA
ncbi:hypothetical protein CgunFtcFv8_006634 [Champsocephalus gunnari]|uniref:Uncharacterized protein n=1 Tax=Champsocephalus gunnari TaxID=52237 RepID=A0AAN8GX55_CHAGU|nr:hypothetical protein CgunFtcFv8_006634 [Champsocephalus gunnari]